MYDTEFRNNSAEICVSVGESSIEIERCLFVGNTGNPIWGGGKGSHTAIIRDCEFIENRTTCSAGAGVGFMTSVLVEGNTFVRNASLGGQCSSSTLVIGSSSSVTVRFNTFAHDSTMGGGGGVGIGLCAEPVEISHNTIYGCHAPLGSAVAVALTPSFCFDHNLISSCTGGAAAWNLNSTITSGSCNDFWNNEGGNFYDWIPTPTDFFEDPLLCDPENLDLSLHADSPCAPGNTPGCEQVGAHGVGCGTVAVRSSSWAGIKAKYRDGGSE
jgi:hypothetical protein